MEINLRLQVSGLEVSGQSMSGLQLESYLPLDETRFASKVLAQVMKISPTGGFSKTLCAPNPPRRAGW